MPEAPRQPIADALRRSRKDPEAFGTVYREHARAIVAFVARRVYELDTATDLAAESFARAYLKRSSFRGRTDAEALQWLYTIANRITLQFLRRNVIERRALERLGLDPPQLTDEDQERVLELAGLESFHRTVRTGLTELSAGNREALQLRIVDELPYEQVAARLGVSQQTARARVSRALRALAVGLEADDVHLKETTT